MDATNREQKARRRRAAQAQQRAEKTADRVCLPLGAIYGGDAARMAPGGELSELAASIARYGLLSPIVVRHSGQAGRYALVCGARRLAACRMLGWTRIDAVVVDAGEREAALCFMEEQLTARAPDVLACAQLLRGAGDAQASSSGLQRTCERIRALGALEEPVQAIVRGARLSLAQAEPLLDVADPARQLEAASIIAQRALTPAQARRLVSGPQRIAGSPAGRRRAVRAALEEISALVHRLGRQGVTAQMRLQAQEGVLTIELEMQNPKR